MTEGSLWPRRAIALNARSRMNNKRLALYLALLCGGILLLYRYNTPHTRHGSQSNYILDTVFVKSMPFAADVDGVTLHDLEIEQLRELFRELIDKPSRENSHNQKLGDLIAQYNIGAQTGRNPITTEICFYPDGLTYSVNGYDSVTWYYKDNKDALKGEFWHKQLLGMRDHRAEIEHIADQLSPDVSLENE